MNARPLALSLAVAATLGLAACGDDNDSAAEETKATPAQAVSEIAATRAALDQGLEQLKSGDRKAAEATVGDGYLEHFEIVEGPLEEADHELNEKIEHTLREELRDKIKDGASVAEVTALVNQIKADLATAERTLQQ